jgi:GT2 family glycosyltransferase
MSRDLTIVICTHNRSTLLQRTIASLNRAARPTDWTVNLLVVANACTDDTVPFLEGYARDAPARGWLPMRHGEEPEPGKSRALNLAIKLIDSVAVAYVDDDHRVDEGYVTNVCRALGAYPEASLFCGRIVPDWDGREPNWVHDTGPYRIYPLPVPRFDIGSRPMRVEPGTATPGGGNLFLRTELFNRVGEFSLEFGPTGHDLGGAEDIEWVKRAIAAGAIVQYDPSVVQYHYVDPERLRLAYLARKAYLRSSSIVRLSPELDAGGGVPLYMYRKAGTYLIAALGTLVDEKRRFYLVRFAAALGEIDGAHKRLVAAA